MKTFTARLKEFDDSLLSKSDKRVKNRPVHYPDVEKKLVQYVEFRQKKWDVDHIGLNWEILKIKAIFFANKLGHSNFDSTNGWLGGVCHRNDIHRLLFHGEANEINNTTYNTVLKDWKENILHPTIIKSGITDTKYIYNCDETALFYNKIPNSSYLITTKCATKNIHGCKKMYSKEKISLMVCIGADGTKLPLMIVGKSEKPVCFPPKDPPSHINTIQVDGSPPHYVFCGF